MWFVCVIFVCLLVYLIKGSRCWWFVLKQFLPPFSIFNTCFMVSYCYCIFVINNMHFESFTLTEHIDFQILGHTDLWKTNINVVSRYISLVGFLLQIVSHHVIERPIRLRYGIGFDHCWRPCNCYIFVLWCLVDNCPMGIHTTSLTVIYNTG